MSVAGQRDGASPADRRRREVAGPATRGVGRAALRLHPAAGSAVMGTGIVAVALRTTGHRGPSLWLLAAAVVLAVVLAGIVVARALRAPGAVVAGARHPEALTAVAAVCVLGSWCVADGKRDVAWVLLVAGALLWTLLIGPALRHLPERAHGSTFLVCVATEAVAALAAGLAAAADARWLLLPASVLAVLGLLLYLDVLRRFGPGELLRGRGDHWVAGGAVAIATLAGAKILAGTTALGVVPGVHDALRAAVLVLALVSAAWLVVLVVAEVARPRPRYDAARWSTVFPAGMFAAAAAAAGSATGHRAFTRFAEVWVWIALAVWAVVLAGLLRAAVRER